MDYRKINLLFKPKSVAIIGASENPDKVGHVIMQNYIDVGFSGKIYPINKDAEKVLGMKAYKNIKDVGAQIDLAVIAIPAEGAIRALDDCGKSGVKSAIVVASGFSEIGRDDLQTELVEISEKYNMPILGPNCLGVMDMRSRVDTMFLPTFKLDKPKIGGVAFVSQSGAVGSTVLDMISHEGFGLSKFISYGNAAVIDEVDLLEYLLHDDDTKIVLFYMEGVKRGRKFMETVKRFTQSKPIIMAKGGITPEGSKAAHSHTASLAGSAMAYEAVFKQYGLVHAKDIDDLLSFGKIFETENLSQGKRVAIITNGGGTGVLATDALYSNGLELAELSGGSAVALRKVMPNIVNVRMPLDMGGDADDKRFAAAMDIVTKDQSADMIMVISLFQTPGADSRVAATLIHYKSTTDKPMVVVSPGGNYAQVHNQMMESSGLPVYESPSAAARAMKALLDYSNYIRDTRGIYGKAQKRQK
jgi:acetyl coenzyme A synthetase (ADP forming)-like protein